MERIQRWTRCWKCVNSPAQFFHFLSQTQFFIFHEFRFNFFFSDRKFYWQTLLLHWVERIGNNVPCFNYVTLGSWWPSTGKTQFYRTFPLNLNNSWCSNPFHFITRFLIFPFSWPENVTWVMILFYWFLKRGIPLITLSLYSLHSIVWRRRRRRKRSNWWKELVQWSFFCVFNRSKTSFLWSNPSLDGIPRTTEFQRPQKRQFPVLVQNCQTLPFLNIAMFSVNSY